MKKLLAVMLCFTVICCSCVFVNAENAEYSLLDNSYVRLLGRGELTSEESRGFNWPNAGFEFEFSGTVADVYVDISSYDTAAENGNFFTMAVYNGDELIRTNRMKLTLGWNNIYTYQSGDPDVKKIMLVRSSEACRGTISMSKLRTDSVPVASQPRAKLIEFIGDSYTAGYGNSTHIYSEAYTASNTDNWNSYTGVVARHYNADNNVIAYQGKGVYANRNISAVNDTMSHQFNYEEICVDTNADINLSTRVAHNFSKYQPHLVTVWLGTNDAAASVPVDTFKEAYIKLLDNIRRKYPDSTILCMAIPGKTYTAEIEAIVKDEARGEKNKYYFHSVASFKASGASGHPNVSEDKVIGEELIETIDKIPGVWDMPVYDYEDEKLISFRANYNTGDVSVFGKTDYRNDSVSVTVVKSGTDFSTIGDNDIKYLDQVEAKYGEYSFEFAVERILGEYIISINSTEMNSLNQRSFAFVNFIPSMTVQKGEEIVASMAQLEENDVIKVTLSGFKAEEDFSGMLAIAQYNDKQLVKVDVFDASDDSRAYGTEITKEAVITGSADCVKIIYMNKKTNAPLIGTYVIE